jgi:hypothetical protein
MRNQEMIVAVALIAGVSMAQQSDRVADLQAPLWRQPLSAIVRLTAQTVSQTAKPGEPVRVRLTLKNVSSGPAGYGEELGNVERSYVLAVFREDGTAAPRVPPKEGVFGERGSVVRKTLDPGEEATDTLEVSKVFDLTRKGKYYVRVAKTVYRPSKAASREVAISDVVTFVIAE